MQNTYLFNTTMWNSLAQTFENVCVLVYISSAENTTFFAEREDTVFVSSGEQSVFICKEQ